MLLPMLFPPSQFSQAFEQSTIAFRYTADEVGVVWSPNHGMAAFIESRGRDVIAAVNGDFFKVFGLEVWNNPSCAKLWCIDD